MILTRDVPLKTVRLCFAEEVRFKAELRPGKLAEAFATVPREHFLGPGPWKVAANYGYLTTEDDDPRQLYHDSLFAIDPERKLNNGHPSSLAGWIDTLQLQTGDRVVHIGCGVGYYTAIMAYVVGPAGFVPAIEVDPGIAARARQNLSSTRSVEVIEGDGIHYDFGESDAIFVNAGVTHPQLAWLERLRPGGRLLFPLTVTRYGFEESDSSGGKMVLIVKEGRERFAARIVSNVSIYPAESGRDESLEPALREALEDAPGRKRSAPRWLRVDAHRRNDTCWLHGKGWCLSSS
jgi:protein-L-isoaspartate(D-aspartate) O-methyltransferase